MNFGVPGRGHQGDWTLMLTLRDQFLNPLKRWALSILIAQTFMA